MPSARDTDSDTLPARIAAASRRPSTLGASVAGVVSLAMGEPDMSTPRPVVDAAIDALRAGHTRYAPLTGAPRLRRRLAEHLTAISGRPVSTDHIVLTHGGSAALSSTFLALVSPGAKVLVPEPTYSLYADQIVMAGGEVVWVGPGADGRIDFDAIDRLAGDATAVVICNPVNPTGQVLRDSELDRLTAILRRHEGLTAVVDEAYSDIVFDDRAFRSALSLDVPEQIIVVGTFSKSYAMTGWRLGYAVTARHASAINLVHRTVNGALNTFVQDAGMAALDIGAAELAAQTAAYQRRRDIAISALDAMPGVSFSIPEGAFYVFPRIDSTASEDQLLALLDEAGVLVRGGSEYGPSGAGHIRISFATDEESLIEGLRRLAAVIEQVMSRRQ